MHGLTRLGFIFLLFVLSTPSQAEELPVESFSQLPNHVSPNLSPSGYKVSYIRNYQSPEVAVLTAEDLMTGKKQLLVKFDNEERKINWFKWANDKTLIVSVRFATYRHRVKFSETRLLAFDTDGKEPVQRQLIKPRGGIERTGNVSQFQDRIVSFLPDDPEHILIALDLDVPNLPDVYKLNIYTRKKTRVIRGKLAIRDWKTDRQGKLRLGHALNYKTGEASTKVRMNEDSEWQTLFEYNSINDPAITPIGFAKDPNILYYKKYHNDKKALFKIDLTSKESTLVFSDDQHDVDGSLLYSKRTNDAVGVYHANAENGLVYWDENLNKFQKSLNKTFPDSYVSIQDFSQDENIYLLHTENDHTPGLYYLGDRKEKFISPFFDKYPALEPNFLTEHKLVTYTARDGVEIEGYLTLPLNTEGPVPTVLHPHGGPGAREYDGFDYWTSFFANRGYAVFRPNFRGSTGYGYAFAQSQMQGWGLTMQDDLTDAAKWLVSEKIAQDNNICIVGASYGGYAAAMAAIKTPDLFKCAISFAGVTNLKELVIKSRRFVNSKFVKKQLGDDTDDLEARSPYYQAEKVKIPMLFIHGEDDRVVDVEQSRMMVDELEDLDKPVEYIELENGDHYLSIQRNRHATFKAMDRFLKQHLSN